jgi:hypothetical protein
MRRLAELERTEQAIAQEVGPCLAEYQATVQTVSNEILDDVLQRNLPAAREELRRFKEVELAKLLPYLEE